MITSSRLKRNTIAEQSNLRDSNLTWRFPSFINLSTNPEFKGSMIQLLKDAQNKVKEYVKFNDWIDKKIEKSEFADVLKFKSPEKNNISFFSMKNHEVLIWMFKFIFNMEDFWLKRAIMFEFKLNVVRFIDRLKCKFPRRLSGISNKTTSKMITNKIESSRQQIFNLCAYLILHEYYFVQTFGKPTKFLNELTDLEWAGIFEQYLTTRQIDFGDLYKKATKGYKPDYLNDRFEKSTKILEKTYNRGNVLSN